MTHVVASLLLCLLVEAASARTVLVSQEAEAPDTTTFYEAVADPDVQDIVFISGYTLGDEFSAQAAGPVQLSR